jgi:hypothetical protein
MAQLILPPIPVFNSETNQLESKIIVKDENGLTAQHTQIFQTSEGGGLSGALFTDDLSEHVDSEKLLYSTTYGMAENSLSVYYNGLNIIRDVDFQSTNTFVIDSEYKNLINKGDSLIAIYTRVS